MGVQDRDWYWKDRDEKQRAEQETAEAVSTAHRKTRDPAALIRHVNRSTGPKLWGADWHWTIQLLVWLCIAVLLLLAWRLVK